MAASRARVTAKDVAREAGVSQSTVSYVLNDTPNQTIPPATRRRVLDAVEKLHYAPSAAARALRKGTSSTILLVLLDAPIGGSVAGLIEELSDDFERHGLSLVFRRHRGTEALERAWREIRPAAVVDVAALSEEQTAAIVAAGIPVVRGILDGSGHGIVSVPEIVVGRLQAAHLLERGHRRLGYAAPVDPRVSVFYDLRLRGVREVLAAARLPEPVVVPLPQDATQAAAAIAPWVTEGLDTRVTAVCAYNDEQAFALLAGMRILGLRAPDDLAVVGVDNVPLAPFAAPPLTTVDSHIPEVAETLATAVLDAIAGREPATSPLTATLVRRDST